LGVSAKLALPSEGNSLVARRRGQSCSKSTFSEKRGRLGGGEGTEISTVWKGCSRYRGGEKQGRRWGRPTREKTFRGARGRRERRSKGEGTLPGPLDVSGARGEGYWPKPRSAIEKPSHSLDAAGSEERKRRSFASYLSSAGGGGGARERRRKKRPTE